MTKVCKICKIEKDVNKDFKNDGRWASKRKICKDCVSSEDLNKKEKQRLESQNRVTSKTCIQCNQTKPINLLNSKYNIIFKNNGFYIDSEELERNYSDYFNRPYRSLCKECYDLNNPIQPGLKKCSTCGCQKNPNEFTKDSTNEDGLRKDCKVCHNRGTKKNQAAGRPNMIQNTKDAGALKVRAQLNRIIGRLSRKDVGLLRNEGVCHDGVDYSLEQFISMFPNLDDMHLDHIFPIHFIDFEKPLSITDELNISKFINSLENFRLLPATSTDTQLGNLNRRYLNDPDDKQTIINTYNVLKAKYPYLDSYLKEDILTQLN